MAMMTTMLMMTITNDDDDDVSDTRLVKPASRKFIDFFCSCRAWKRWRTIEMKTKMEEHRNENKDGESWEVFSNGNTGD